MKKHVFDMSASEFFESTERTSYGVFSEVAARAGIAVAGQEPIQGGLAPSNVSYNPIRANKDWLGDSGVWDVHLGEQVWRLATPRVLANQSLPMLVVRSMVVMRQGVTINVPEEIITRPPVYRSEMGDDVLLEVTEANVAFGGDSELALTSQARYLGWLNVTREFLPQAAAGR